MVITFHDKSLTSVTIPGSVESIGDGAFGNNSLTLISIPDSVTTIGRRAFGSNNLQTVLIGSGVTSIGSGAFNNNQISSVTGGGTSDGIIFARKDDASITVPDSVTSIGSAAFCDNSIETLTLGSKVTSIDTFAFSTNSLTSETIPNSVQSIGYQAFYNNSLESVTLGTGLNDIGEMAFNNNQITSVTGGGTSDGIIFGRHEDCSIDDSVIASYGGVSKVIDFIPESVTAIEKEAFDSSSLTSVTIPNNVRKVGDYAFSSNSLTSISIPQSVTYIGVFALDSNAFSTFALPTPSEPNFLNWKCGSSTYNGGDTVSVSNSNPYEAQFQVADDTTLPLVNSATILTGSVEKGGTVSVSLDVTEEDTGVTEIQIVLYAYNGDERREISSNIIEYSEPYLSGTIEVDIDVPLNAFAGTYRIGSIHIGDQAGNLNYYSDGFPQDGYSNDGTNDYIPKYTNNEIKCIISGEGTTTVLEVIGFAQGDGTEANPYGISTPAQLNDVRNYSDAHFILLNNIDLSAATSEGGDYYNDGAGWEPISGFIGTFDGGGYEIKGLNIDRYGQNAALFGGVGLDGEIKNLGVVDSIISGNVAGGIAAVNYGLIHDCYSKSDINVSGQHDKGGGIAGTNSGIIQKCYNESTITSGDGYIGGITGENRYIIADCYNAGAVHSWSNDCFGGITGSLMYSSFMYTASITNCYNVGSITQEYSTNPGEIAGAIVGQLFGGYITNCYYLDNIEQVTCSGNFGVNNIQLTNTQMQQQSNFDTFNFDHTWEMPSNGDYLYPVLQLGNSIPQTGPSSDFAGGTGSTEDPYQITTPGQLNSVRVYHSSAFILMNDIDLEDATSDGGDYYFDGQGWEPIGNFAYPFKGKIDGNGYEITGLKMDRDYVEGAGLFGITQGATIKDLGVIVEIETTTRRVGGVVGMALDTTISGCYASGNMENYSYSDSYAGFGGIVGYSNGVVELCYNKAKLFGSNRIGGVVGWNHGGTVKTSYNNGHIISTGGTAGIAGHNTYGGIVMDCYNAGHVTGPGIVYDNQSGYFYRCYNVGVADGVVGSTRPDTIEDSYYLEPEVDNQSTAVAKTDAELQQEATYTNYDFSEVWTMNGNAEYPYPELLGNVHDSASENEITFEGGDGTQGAPYQISTPTQLDAIRYNPEKHYILINDIDLGPATSEGGDFYYNGSGWYPICWDRPFLGSLDGNGYSIFNLKGAELFGTIGDSNDIGNSGVIQNIRLENVDIDEGFAGIANINYGTISNCSVTGEIYGGSSGIVNSNYYLIDKCHNDATITVSSYIGGIARYNAPTGTINRCYNSGYIQGSYTGGITHNNFGTIENCFNISDLYGFGKTGGIAVINSGSIINCYSTGKVEISDNYVHGYSGIVVENESTINNCYYLDNVDVGIYEDSGNISNVLMKTIEEMQHETTFNGFDFINTWEIIEGERMPVLQDLDFTYVTGITLDVTSIEIQENNNKTITAIISPQNATNKSISWSSDDESVATVENGTITVVSVGTARITVTTQDGGFTDACDVTVTQPATGVNLDKSMIGLLVGETDTLTETVEPSDATNTDVTWSSSNNSVATVADGVVTGVSKGTATITVTTVDGGFTDTCVVTVKKAVTGVSLDKETDSVNVGNTTTLAETVSPSDASNKDVTWSSDNESVATVADGVVTGVSKGTATIIVTTDDGGFTDTCVVTVTKAVTGVSLDKETDSVNVGNTTTLAATVSPSDASNKDVTWSSSNNSVATVVDGVVTGVSKGTATITVTTVDGGFTDTCIVTVTKPVTGVSLDKETDSVNVGEVAMLAATVSPTDASNKDVTWSSDNNSVATVTDGVVTGVAKGTATITVTTVDGGYTDTCVVTVTKAVTYVCLNKVIDSIKIGDTTTIVATVSPSDATNKNVTWTSSNNSVATVADGVVTGVSKGTATITVTTEDGGYTDTCEITVTKAVAGVSLDKKTDSVSVGNTTTLTATVSPSDAGNKDVTWSSSNNSVATVADGVVTGVSVGTATITVTTADGGYTDTCEISVTHVPVTSVSLEWSALTVYAQTESLWLMPTVYPENASNKNLVWTSSDSSVVAVYPDGLISPLSSGTATITATTEDGGFTDTCVVTVKERKIESNAYSIGDTYISGIAVNTSVEQLKANLLTNPSWIKIFDAAGTEYTGSTVTTGMKVKFYLEGDVADELTIIILGDANGDGKISITDYTLARLDILGLKELGQVGAAAADINGDGKVSITDYTLMRLDILGLKKIH